MRTMSMFLIWTWLTAACGFAGAAEFHVAPGGDDANPGTATLPWRTLAQANATVAPAPPVVVVARVVDMVVQETPNFTALPGTLAFACTFAAC